MTWDYSGNAVTFTNELGHSWQRTYDAFGRLTNVVEPTGGTTAAYTYDALDDLTGVSQGAESRSYIYDSLSRLRTATNPESGTVNYTYYPNSDLHTKTDARGITTTYVYDELDRVKSKTYSDATYPVAYTYDISSGPSTMNTVGRLTDEKTTVQGMAMTERAIDRYDAMGRVKSERQCFVGGCGAHAYTLRHSYNLAGDVIAANNGMSNTYAESFGYSYDGAGRLQTVTSSLNDATHPATLFQAQQYGPIGLLQAGYGLPNIGGTPAFTQILTYDNRTRLSSETDTTPAPATLYSDNVGYDGASNVTSLADTQMGQWSYSYDALDRLYTATATAGTYNGLTLTEAYDVFGNRLSQTPSGTYGGTVPQPSPVTFNGGKNRVDQWGYDAAGDVVNDGTNMYQYDAEGRQTGTLNSMSGLTGYIYDAEGRRAMKIQVNGFGTPHATTTIRNEYLLGLNGEQVTVLDGSNNWQWTNVYAGGKQLATYDLTGTHFPLTDWLGSKRVEVNVSGPSAVTMGEQCLSLPYGDGLDCAGADSNHLHFTGKQRDSESDNDYFGARYYGSNVAGRFMSPDPLPWIGWQNPPESSSEEAKEEAHEKFENWISNPQNFNLYAYVNSNPLNHTDPTGMAGCKAGDKTFNTCTITITYDPKMSKGTLIVTGMNKGDKSPTTLLTTSVVVGGDGHVTPTGTFHASYWEKDHVSTKYGTWANTPYSKTKFGINAFGPYQLHIRELEGRGIYIHGTIGPNWNPFTFGNTVVGSSSHGCVRMCNADDNALHTLCLVRGAIRSSSAPHRSNRYEPENMACLRWGTDFR